jgi:DNA repair protein RadA/Sms
MKLYYLEMGEWERHGRRNHLMKKSSENIAFFCQSCGHSEKKWHGRCPNCQEWNSLVEERVSKKSPLSSDNSANDKPLAITSVGNSAVFRRPTGIAELDRVLGGGIVLGSVTLIGGEPGCGKSTLLQMAGAAMAKLGHKVLYISGEESKEQIRLAAERLDALNDKLFVLSETDIDIALQEALILKPDFMVVDSVQTVFSRELESQAGTVGQIREVCGKLVRFAKDMSIPTFLVGHVTKDGNIAGPRLLEHMVDCVLYFEQSRSDQYRLLRAHKNRFGGTNEIGLFEMGQKGLQGIENPSAFFLAERPEDKPGSSVFCALEGTRPLLVEIQALTVETLFGTPRRVCVGVDSNRCSVIAAVLEKHGGLMLSRLDLFVSVAGGIDIKEPALDLALALAIASSVKNIPLPFDMVCCGELGLSGEIRSVFRINDRLKEAARLGFTKGLIPRVSVKHLTENFGMRLKGPSTIEEAITLLVR